MKNHKTERTARQKAKQKVEFKIHMIAYIVVNSLLAIINLTFTPGYLWFIWPLLGWGVGIVLHRREFKLPPKQSWMDRLIEKEMEKH
ncbi:2TM domain-containing protein [Sunxiuqinia sp. sy24]|uniref:2TM domain-containing protein n=1 Tax=Sunxiuqinia sp. sy24 TaxID=3461495 RepID=UPI004045D19B